MTKYTALCAAMALAMSASMASATTTVTFTGKIANVVTAGNSGIYFGSGIIAGTTDYSLVYTIHEDAGTISHPDSYTTKLQGIGAVTAVMTINGYSQSVSGTATNVVSSVSATNAKPLPPGGPTDAYSIASRDFTDNGSIYHDAQASSLYSSYLTDFLSAADYNSPFSVGLVSADSYLSYFVINDLDVGTKASSYINLSLAPGMITVAVSRVEEPNTPPVPEPASWAMMIGGFALAGGMLRQKRASARLIAA